MVFTAQARDNAWARAQNKGKEGKQKRCVRLTGEECICRFVQRVAWVRQLPMHGVQRVLNQATNPPNGGWSGAHRLDIMGAMAGVS